MEWQPYTTAPKDGTTVILHDNRVVGGWSIIAVWEDGFWWSSEGHRYGDDWTHWAAMLSCPEAA